MIALVLLMSMSMVNEKAYAEPGYAMNRVSEAQIRRFDPDFFKVRQLLVGAPEARTLEGELKRLLGPKVKLDGLLKADTGAFTPRGSGLYWLRYKDALGIFRLGKFQFEGGKVKSVRYNVPDAQDLDRLFTDPKNDVFVNGTRIIPTQILDVPGITDNGIGNR